MSLPSELRMAIYKLFLGSVLSESGETRPRITHLLCTSTTIYAEALSVLFTLKAMETENWADLLKRHPLVLTAIVTLELFDSATIEICRDSSLLRELHHSLPRIRHLIIWTRIPRPLDELDLLRLIAFSAVSAQQQRRQGLPKLTISGEEVDADLVTGDPYREVLPLSQEAIDNYTALFSRLDTVTANTLVDSQEVDLLCDFGFPNLMVIRGPSYPVLHSTIRDVELRLAQHDDEERSTPTSEQSS